MQNVKVSNQLEGDLTIFMCINKLAPVVYIISYEYSGYIQFYVYACYKLNHFNEAI